MKNVLSKKKRGKSGLSTTISDKSYPHLSKKGLLDSCDEISVEGEETFIIGHAGHARHRIWGPQTPCLENYFGC